MKLKNLNINFWRKYGLGLLLTISWAIQAYPILMTKPNFKEVEAEFKKFQEDTKKEFEESGGTLSPSVSTEATQNALMELRTQWLLNIIVVSVGLASAIFSLFQVRYWKIAVIFTSIIYLGLWISYGSFSIVPPITAMQLKWMIAKMYHNEMSFFIRDVALPLLYIWSIGFLSFSLYSSLTKKSIKKTMQ